jgi:WD40 repeat protein
LSDESNTLCAKILYRLENAHTNVVYSIDIFQPSNCDSSPLLITGSFDNRIIIWDAETGKEVKQLQGHTDSVTAVVVYSPQDSDTPQLITTSVDKTIIIWNLNTGEILRKLIGHTDRVCSLAVYSPQKKCKIPPLIVSGSDGRFY